MLSIRRHLVVMILAQLAGGFVGAFIGALINVVVMDALGLGSDSGLPGLTGLVMMGAGAYGGFLAMQTLFRNLIPARCARETCSGAANCVGSMPISYKCGLCGHLHETTFYLGGK